MLEQYKWRFRAKVVAWLDLSLKILALVAVLLIAILVQLYVNYYSNAANNPNNQHNHQDFTTSQNHLFAAKLTATIIWLVAAVFTLVSLIEIWASFKLLKATDIGQDPKEAFNMAWKWVVVEIVFLVVGVIANCIAEYYLAVVVAIATRGIFITIVYKYMAELEDEMKQLAQALEI